MAIDLIDEHKNSNGILVSPCKDFGEGYAEAAVTPGTAVIQGTAAGDVAEAGALAGDTLGIALDNVSSDSEDLRADYAIGERVRYGREPGFKFMGLITDAGTVTKGAKLEAAANGELQLQTTGDAVAIYLGEDDLTAPSSAYGLCKYGGVA